MSCGNTESLTCSSNGLPVSLNVSVGKKKSAVFAEV